jgi:DNA-binding CsgD family transcriptional regulator
VQDRQAPLDLFVGRAAELERVAEVVTRVEAGEPWLVALEGVPGVGKTALARRSLAGATGLRVLSARADQTETDLEFGLVEQLLRAAGGVSQPVPASAGTGSPASSFAVGARLLEVVGELAATAPVAIVIDDLQWADRTSVEALTFMLRRLSVDPVLAVVIYRGRSDRLDEAAQRMLRGIENRLRIPLGGLRSDEVASLVAALKVGSLDDEAVQWLYRGTGGHPLFLRTVLSEGFDFDPRAPGRLALPRSLAAAVGDLLRVLPPDTRAVLEMLSVLNLRMPIAQLGEAAEVESPSAAVEPAVAAGLVDWWPEEPSCPVALRHLLVQGAIYASITAARRRLLHARAAGIVSEAASWEHRVAALDLLAGDLGQAVSDLTASVRMARKGATITLGLRAYFYLALAQYLAGAWDDVLLTAEQGFSAAAIHARRYELPLLHLAAGCVPAGRGVAGEAERHARLAEEAAASLDYGQERLYAAMARALVCQASGDYLGMADALGYWRDDAALDGRSRMYAVLWRPLLAEGLVGSGQSELAATVLDQLRTASDQVSYLQPALAWLEGWLTEQRGTPEQALRIYQRGEDTASTQSPVQTARLLLAHGRLLRRTGDRKGAVERLRRAHALFLGLRAAPCTAQVEQELAACHLPGNPVQKHSALALTSRETEVAHLVGKGLSNPEVAAELFISRKAVEYHLGNIYAKCGLQGRQQLRRLVGQWRQPAVV